MEIKHIKCGDIAYMTFQNIYDDNELRLIWQEAEFLCHEEKLMTPEQTGSASINVDNNRILLKKNLGVWLNQVYVNIKYSNYGKLHKKFLIELQKNKDELIERDLNLKQFFATNGDTTLLSYYENSDYYDAHTDRSSYTYVFWLFKEPKLFTGGDLTFPELNQTINVKSNMAVLFPSWLDHQVDKISMCDTIEKFNCNGRFAFTTFFNIVD